MALLMTLFVEKS